MKQIKLTGREHAILRSIDFSGGGTPGSDILENSRIEKDEAVDVLNGLMDVGFVECEPMQMHVTPDTIESTLFEVNPSYALQLKEAMIKRY